MEPSPLEAEDTPVQARPGRTWKVRLYEAAVSLPVLAYLIWSVLNETAAYQEAGVFTMILWAVAISAVDLMPVPTTISSVGFSLSFPLELSVALLYPTPVAATIALFGSSDPREFRREIPVMKALFIRAQIAAAVMAESAMFRVVAHDSLQRLARDGAGITADVIGPIVLGVILAAICGYTVNLVFVSVYGYFQDGENPLAVIKQIHVGVFGEFLLSYMGLALFSVLVAMTFQKIGAWAIFVFVAPLAFARQMFMRTHSLQQATEELAVRQAENEHQALHDSLTGMPNRMLFQQRLAASVEETRVRGGGLAVMLIDLDHFKEINDTLGHHFGDLLLQEIGPRLSSVLRDGDLMARLGGDEFGVVLPDVPNEDTIVRIVVRMLEALEQPVTVEGLALDVSGSVGIAMFPGHANDTETLLRRADVAMYAAKENGVGFEMYRDELDRYNPQRLTLIGQMRPALEAGEFSLFYQPKVRLSDGRIAGAEALIRWHHPTLGLVQPDEFVPLVEKTVLLRPLTRFAVGSALKQWREWANLGIRLPIAVNISTRSLLDNTLPDTVAELLGELDVPAAFLRMELTESFLMGDSARSIAVLDALSSVGIGLSIDDFGTGYSSLSYLKRLPIEEIKVDRTFVQQMHVDANDFMIVRATVDLGRNLGLRVVAEGVEDLSTFDRLAEFGCDEAQGYYIAPPMSAVEFTRWLSVRNLEQEPPIGARSQAAEQAVPGSRNRLHAV